MTRRRVVKRLGLRSRAKVFRQKSLALRDMAQWMERCQALVNRPTRRFLLIRPTFSWSSSMIRSERLFTHVKWCWDPGHQHALLQPRAHGFWCQDKRRHNRDAHFWSGLLSQLLHCLGAKSCLSPPSLHRRPTGGCSLNPRLSTLSLSKCNAAISGTEDGWHQGRAVCWLLWATGACYKGKRFFIERSRRHRWQQQELQQQWSDLWATCAATFCVFLFKLTICYVMCHCAKRNYDPTHSGSSALICPHS